MYKRLLADITTLLRDKRYAALILVLLGATLFISVQKADFMAEKGSDFAVFWWAGKNFLAGNDLYSNIGGAERFIYPPFAAMWFQLFGINTYRGAAICWGFANFGFYALSIAVMHKIYSHFYENSSVLKWSIAAAAVLSFRYFWYHQIYIQMNEVMFLLCLLGILSYLRKRETAAAAFFVAGAFIKVLPIFFLVWLVSKGNWQNSLKNALKIAAIAAICVLLPMLFRGFEQGWIDHIRYYETFLEPFQHGRVEPQFCNYSLSSMLYNWCQPTQNEPLGFSYRIFMLTLVQTQLVYKVTALALVAAWFAILAYSRFITQKTSFWELAYTFLLMNLLSGITWEYHLVPIIFVFIPVLYTILQKNTAISFLHRVFLYKILAISFFLNIVGRDTVGEKGMHYIGGYGLLTVVWLVLAVYCVYCFFVGAATSVAAKTR